MKYFCALGLCMLSFAVGCSSHQNTVVLDCAGPNPGQPTNGNSTNGTLIVYSARQTGADFNSRDPYRPEYSSYAIYDLHGHRLETVDNATGTIFQGPAPVKLAAAQYRIVAKANGYGYVTVPVVIKGGENTILHLEGGSTWQNQSGFNQTNAVRLPGGEIVGWRTPSKL